MISEIKIPQSTLTKNLHGKYLSPIYDFASALNFDDPYRWVLHLQDHALIAMITKLHGEYLSIADALDFMMTEYMSFMQELKDESGSLNDPKNKVHFDAFVERLKNSIESLPRTYMICIEAPDFPTLWPGRIQLSSDITLVTGTAMPAPVPRGPEEGLPQRKPKRITFWEFRVKGYASNRAHSASVSDYLTQAKLLAFNLVNSGLFFRASRTMGFSASLTPELTGETVSFPLPHALRRCLNIVAKQEELFSYEGTVETGGLGGLSNGDQNALLDQRRENASLSHSLTRVARFFGAKSRPDYPSVSAAIEWYEDSLSAENETFAFLAACIGLEAILGSDESITGLSNRLADRFAFMLGCGRKQREKLTKQYATVLNVRGRLVHAKAARLTADELTQLGIARQMLHRVINHEVETMLKN